MKLKTEERLNASVEEVSPNKTNTSIEDGVQTKTVDDSSATVFPVTPEIAKKLAEDLKIEVDGKNLKYNVNDVDLNAYGITTFESLIFANVVAANINEEFFCGYFQALKTLEEKGYVKCVDGCWLPAYAEKYDEITKIKAISLLLSRYMFLPSKDVYERMIDFIFYYENVQAKFNLCDNCPYCEKDIDGLPDGCLVSFEQDKCRNRLLYLVKTGVIK